MKWSTQISSLNEYHDRQLLPVDEENETYRDNLWFFNIKPNPKIIQHIIKQLI